MSYFVKSLLFFFTNLFRERKYDIVFYYPCHFNRGDDSQNIYFKHFFHICDQKGIKYIVFEEPDLSKNHPRNSDAVPFDFPLLTILLLRKLINIEKFESFEHREWFIAKILKPLFFRKFTFNNYIVLSNSMMGFFRGLEKEARLFDYQHGVITSSHRGYVSENHEAANHLKLNDANVLVYGKGFAQVLRNAVTDSYFDSHVFAIGNNLQGKFKNHSGKRNILFSLQFADPNPVLNQEQMRIILNFFETNPNFFISNGINILMKHHPRFQNDIDVSPLEKFEFTSFFYGTLFEGLNESFLHITLHSTTTFEAASVGVPTLLLKNSLLNPDFFIKDYNYPLGTLDGEQIVEKIGAYLRNKTLYQQDAKHLFEWYKNFYSSFNDDMFLGLLKGTK